MEMGSISSGAQTTSIPAPHQLSCSTVDGPQFHGNMDGQCTGSSKVLLAYKNASQHLSSSGIKAGLGILKVATCQWKQEKKTRSSHPCKRSPLDQLAALVLHDQTRQSKIGHDHRQDPLSSTKPQNCKRIVVLGAPRVGKTSILRRYLRDGFVEEYNPTSEDFLRKLFRIRGETYQIDILDASRERDFPAKRRLSILTGDIFLLVFSLDDRSSFVEVCTLRTEILAAKSKLTKCSAPEPCAQPRVPLVVCANKVDLLESEREISKAEVLQVLGDDCAYFETSAKDSTNLEKVFETLAKRGGLPAETGPSQHRKVSLRSYQAMRTGRLPGKGGQTPRRDDPCGALYPLARRPSFSTDLRQVIGPHTARKPGKALEKCQIQ
ncbi:dexamethasone-induced Ras-related protein 1 [Micropterus dolomieu]|uniref:dexamethasone-induced Ras-related protein 1 n=1 Tax=Micropterus dolomieu TaxID=147949 RepID=UPI001E8E5652|nr:dexamethasone-induced Ras-related protein 1 [Micropterus dolomieu]XP_045895721.1 dexamethasone-induced Ras-related protein 1 [Micropterus dolomieu]